MSIVTRFHGILPIVYVFRSTCLVRKVEPKLTSRAHIVPQMHYLMYYNVQHPDFLLSFFLVATEGYSNYPAETILYIRVQKLVTKTNSLNDTVEGVLQSRRFFVPLPMKSDQRLVHYVGNQRCRLFYSLLLQFPRTNATDHRI